MFSDFWIIMYLAELCEALTIFFGLLGASLLILFGIMGASYLFDDIGSLKISITGVVIGFIMIMFAILIPSNRVVYAYIGGKAIDQAIESATESGIPQRAIDSINKLFDKIDEKLELEQPKKN